MKIKILASILSLSLLLFSRVNAQTWLYFQDSPSNIYYDYSWMELTPPSQLERYGNDLRKFPVESTTPPIQGVNSLRLKWTSNIGGNWYAIAAGTNWTEKDISQSDSLIFWLYSPSGQEGTSLPKIFFEDIYNQKSIMIPIGTYVSQIPVAIWTRISMPMAPFLNQVNPIDYTVIKTIGFSQYANDGVQHTLFVDDMRVIKGDGTSPQVSAPKGLTAKGYEKHAILKWEKNPENNVGGYQVFRSYDNGVTFHLVGTTSNKNDTVYSDYITDNTASGTKLTYGVKAINDAGQPSEMSEPAEAFLKNFSDEELLDMVQEATFRYFWEYGHPVSGMARERLGSGEIVTSGGTGFGIMGIISGIHRGLITRQEGLERILKIVNFLNNADRFHGAWPHWMNGTTGNVIPFSNYDNGGDLVETSFLIQGLLTARSFFDGENLEDSLRRKITSLWESVEWDWYTRNGSDVLYWHWSPNYEWIMNMPIRGYNECMIVYILAIASPTHPVSASLYHTGWAGGNYLNGQSFYGYPLEVGWNYGGPLFFTHYSFLGFDPRSKKDAYTNYFNNNRNTALIHHAYCIDNPYNYPGYSDSCWGLTASDDPDGYLAHAPHTSNDNGTISPTAALSSFPYTPTESMKALKYFYRNLPKTWGYYGFYDAFNQKRNWWATSYLAIDEGPILVMIENYRSALLWNLFMENPEINSALQAIGFTYDPFAIDEISSFNKHFELIPIPSKDVVYLNYLSDQPISVSVNIYNSTGQLTTTKYQKLFFDQNSKTKLLNISSLKRGLHFITIEGHQLKEVLKFLKD
ncbi:MAG TPA: glucoamylase family protein [Bacteroidales bacterium]|nr:glucoamylase family protein [Bacteroidales bacterium]HQQ02678.1 glucoamylase family protein [Bacteroidales bacterium]